MWYTSLNEIIKARDLGLYTKFLNKILENPFETDNQLTKRRRMNRYSIIQYFGKEKSEPYRAQFFKGLEVNLPLDNKELDKIVVDLILPCAQNSSLIPLYYPAV